MRDMRPGNGRGPARIIGRRYLDHIAANQIDPRQIAQDRRRLPARKPAPDRRAGARCKRRIEALQAEHPEFKSLQNPILCIVRGLPASRIVQIAEKWQTCCIVMRKSRRGELLGLLSHSSITDSVTARTSCPVLQIDSLSSRDAVSWLSGTTAHPATSPQISSDPARVQ